jgi:ParB family chromosome partitioning protein
MGKPTDRPSTPPAACSPHPKDRPGHVGEEKANHLRAPTGEPQEPETQEIRLDEIHTGEQTIRADQNDDDIIELAASIAAHGLLQPIGVTPRAGGGFQLLFGARRCAALRRLRRTTAPARIFSSQETSVKATALIENIQRRQMTLEEEVNAVDHLHHQEEKSPDQISDILAKSRTWVMRRLAIPNLPPDLRDPLLDGTLTLGVVETLARIEDDSARRLIQQQAINSKLSVSEVRTLAEIYAAAPTTPEAIAASIAAAAINTPTPQMHLPCDACGALLPVASLRLVRVCPHHLEESNNGRSTDTPPPERN